MKDNSIKLQRLIEELLDYQRALHAAASLAPRKLALDALVRDVAQSHELAAEAKGLRLAVDAQSATVEADTEKLRSIVDITWIISENWLNYVEYHDRELTLEAVVAGYDEILEVLRPYLIGDPQRVTSESYSTLERLTAQN